MPLRFLAAKVKKKKETQSLYFKTEKIYKFIKKIKRISFAPDFKRIVT